MKAKNNHITYIELKANNLETTKTFYNQAFGWVFTDYGPAYVSFKESGVAGGFEKTEDTIVSSVLVVLYHDDIESIMDKIIDLGGRISKEIFSFPGGRRFHFLDPSRNELAVWTDK